MAEPYELVSRASQLSLCLGRCHFMDLLDALCSDDLGVLDLDDLLLPILISLDDYVH